jgi:hypothetical protein
MLHYYIILIILIIIIIIYLKSYFYNFISRDEVNIFLKNDDDNYVNNMSIYDIRARNKKSKIEYLNSIINISYELTFFEKLKIINLCIKVDLFFKNLKSIYLPINNDINYIKWKIVLMNNKNYEEGLSHTRKDIIFISKDLLLNENLLIKTLIHEKIHIYQRYNEFIMTKHLLKLGYKREKKRMYIKLIRSNPDLDNYIYKDKKLNLMYDEYTSEIPNNINDIIKNNNYEHPYEMISYIIENTW